LQDEIDPATCIALLKDQLDLTDPEWRELMSNEAPYLDH